MVRKGELVVAGFCIFLILASLGVAKDIEPLDARLVEVLRTVMGNNESEVLREASLQAVRMCIARVYMSEELIMARELLDKYVEKYPERFIYSREIIEKEHIGDKIRMRMRLYVDNKKLLNDLREKRFLFKPRYRPFFSAFLDESLDGKKASYAIGRKAIADTIVDRGGKFGEEEMEPSLANQDATSEKELFDAACVEAERAGIEIFITGSSASELIEEKELYYDVYYFYRTDAKLKMVRVDTGEVLAESEKGASAASMSKDKAIEISVRRAVGDATSELYDNYKKVWKKLILNEVDYQIMLTDADKTQLDTFVKLLEVLGRDVEVYVKNYDRNIGVINLVYDGKRDDLVKYVLSANYPRLKLIATGGKMIELQVHN